MKRYSNRAGTQRFKIPSQRADFSTRPLYLRYLPVNHTRKCRPGNMLPLNQEDNLPAHADAVLLPKEDLMYTSGKQGPCTVRHPGSAFEPGPTLTLNRPPQPKMDPGSKALPG